MPTPRSQGRSRRVERSATATKWTLQPTGAKAASSAGPATARSTACGSSTTRTRWGLPRSAEAAWWTGTPASDRSTASKAGPGPAVPISTATRTSASSGDPSTRMRRGPAAVSTKTSRDPPVAPVRRSRAWPKHRRPLPLTSARLPSLLNRVKVHRPSSVGVPTTSPSAPIPEEREQSRRASSGPSTGTSSAKATRNSLPRPWW